MNEQSKKVPPERQAQSLPRVIGIDGGGSKTAFVLCASDGTVLARCVRGPSNPANVGAEAARAVLADGIRACLRAAPDGTADAVFAGVAGKRYDEVRELIRSLCPGAAVHADSDAVNVLAAGECDTGIICGTGSVVIASGPEGVRIFGGWGPVMGDSGSAYDIGRAGVRAALAEEQGLGPATAITPLLREALDMDETASVSDRLRFIREQGVSFMASLARAVFAAADGGDAIAAAILDAEMREAMHEVNVARRLCGTGPRVAAAGGVFEHNRPLLLPLMKQYALPDTEFVFPALPPVYGACRRALSLPGIAPDASFADRFAQTYEALSDSPSPAAP